MTTTVTNLMWLILAVTLTALAAIYVLLGRRDRKLMILERERVALEHEQAIRERARAAAGLAQIGRLPFDSGMHAAIMGVQVHENPYAWPDGDVMKALDWYAGYCVGRRLLDIERRKP